MLTAAVLVARNAVSSARVLAHAATTARNAARAMSTTAVVLLARANE
jgi:hypothetical protein